MLVCVKSAPLKFQRKFTKKNQDAPHRWNQTMYSAKTQYSDTYRAELVDTYPTLYMQKVCGVFLNYAIAIDQTMLVYLIEHHCHSTGPLHHNHHG